MRKVKWTFFGYLAFVALTVAGIAVAFNAAPPRDADTYYSTYSGAVKSLDPAEVDDTLGGGILSFIFEGLYNYKYKTVPYEIYPELASDMPAVSPDGMTMTIHIRPGIHYYDPEKTLWPDGVGPEITAADFVYSFKRVCDFNLASDNYSFVFKGHFLGADEWNDYTQNNAGKVDYDKPVEGFSAPDPRTLVLKFTHPYPQMIFNLVNCPCSPVCRAIVEKWGDQTRKHPVGTGPYVLAENLREQRITFAVNPKYRGRPDVDGGTIIPEADRLPHIKRIEWDYYSEEMPVWLQFKRGLFDVSSLPKDAYSQAIGGGGDLTPEMVRNGVVLKKATEPSTSYIGVNMGDRSWAKTSRCGRRSRWVQSEAVHRQIRQRPRCARNRSDSAGVSDVRSETGQSDDPVQPRPGQTAGRRGGQDQWRPDSTDQDPVPGFRYADPSNGRLYVDQMSQIGITLVPVYRDFARWQEMTDARQTQLFDAGWSADYPDEQDFFQLFYSKNIPDAGLNSSVYTNAEFDKLYDQTAVMQDTPERRKLYRRMEDIVEDECPWILVDYPVDFAMSYDWIGDRFTMDYGHGYVQFQTLDVKLREKRLAEMH